MRITIKQLPFSLSRSDDVCIPSYLFNSQDSSLARACIYVSLPQIIFGVARQLADTARGTRHADEDLLAFPDLHAWSLIALETWKEVKEKVDENYA